MPHHRTLAPPPGQRADGSPVIHSELRRHYDAVYDLLLDGRNPRNTGLALDLGAGDGSALGAIALGTGLRGVAVERSPSEHWLGPDGWDVVQADALRLPFADSAFGAALMVDLFEWLRHPGAALAEAGRVTAGPIVVVQTDWDGLWFECEEAETGRELTRLFTSGAPAELPIDALIGGLRLRSLGAAARCGDDSRRAPGARIVGLGRTGDDAAMAGDRRRARPGAPIRRLAGRTPRSGRQAPLFDAAPAADLGNRRRRAKRLTWISLAGQIRARHVAHGRHARGSGAPARRGRGGAASSRRLAWRGGRTKPPTGC